MIKKFQLMVALGVVGASLSATSFAASPGNTADLVVQANRPDVGLNMRQVAYRDLATASPAGQRELMRRVAFAIDSLCEGSDMSITDPIAARRCNVAGWASVQPRLSEILATR